MSATALEVTATLGTPRRTAEWEALAEANGNLVQSAIFDEAQRFYRMVPLYLEASLTGRLVGGVKLYRWQARRAPWLTRRLSLSVIQFGELLPPTDPAPSRVAVASALQAALDDYLRDESVVHFRASGLYGDLTLLLQASGVRPQRRTEFGVAWVDLQRPEEDVWAGLHAKHRSWVRKAERLGVAVAEERDGQTLVELLAESYRTQSRRGPNPDYVRHALASLAAAGRARLFVARHEGRAYAAAMVHRLGPVAYYDFGGVMRNQVGAGHLLHWTIIRRSREEGAQRYVLGQVAAAGGHPDAHFAGGISRFKRSFGAREEVSASTAYALRPWHHGLWSLLTRWTT